MEQKICIFGDSITRGSWDFEEGGWSTRLRNSIETNNYKIILYNCGVSRDNTDKLVKRFKVEATAREPDVIVFAIGINDSQYVNSKDNPRVPLTKFENNLKKLLNQAKEFTNKIIFIGLTPVDESKTMPLPGNANKFYDLSSISKYNSAIKNICQKNKLLFIEVIDLLKNEDLEDGLHPNAVGHKKLCDKIKKSLIDNKII